MSYEYILEDNLENPLRYQYTEYRGAPFIWDWYMSRRQFLDQIEAEILPESILDIQESMLMDEEREGWINSQKSLQILLCALVRNEKLTNGQRHILLGFIKSFEVRKRLYLYYSAQFKPADETVYHNMRLYTSFACVCALAFEFYNDMRYLNALLKVNDTLLSQWGRRKELREPTNLKRMAYAMKKETDFIITLCEKITPRGGEM